MSHYDANFYEQHREGGVASARVIVPRLRTLFRPSSVLDVGCGTGAFLAEFARCGVSECVGVDGEYVPIEHLMIRPDQFRSADLTASLDLGRRFDLVISLEVAEHLPESAARDFVRSLARHGDVVVFSASIPGQYGRHHVNEQWPSYWARLFEAEGFAVYDGLRQEIWGRTEVSWWYRQNLLVFARPEVAVRYPDFLRVADAVRGAPLDVAHPDFMAHFTNSLRTADSVRLSGRQFLRALLARFGWRKRRG